MSYVKSLGGVQSQPPGRPVARFALGGVQSQPPGRPVARFALGADDPGSSSSLSEPTLSDARQDVRDILTTTKQLEAHARERIRKEEIRGWFQIGATLSIPLAAALWRAIGIGRKKKKPA